MRIALLISLALTLTGVGLAAAPLQAHNIIEGRVTNDGGRPLSDIRVLLQNDGYSPVASSLTDAAGHFQFRNLRSGNYYVEVEAGAAGYERQKQRVEAIAFNERRSGGGEVFRVDFVLKPMKATGKGDQPAGAGAGGVLFHQQVPEAARKEFERGSKEADKNSFDNAAAALKRAIALFPDYYDALELLGTEYVKRNDFAAALPLLTHAVEINHDGWRGFYSLGIAQCETNNCGEGIKSLRRATELNPNSPNVNMRLGMALMQSAETRGEAIQALEKVTRQAKDSVPQAYFYLGILYSKNNQYGEAAEALEHFLRVYPQAGEQDKLKQMIAQLRQKAKEQKK